MRGRSKRFFLDFGLKTEYSVFIPFRERIVMTSVCCVDKYYYACCLFVR